jgi:hypothetical protein
MKTAMTEWFDELKANYPYMANEIFDKGFNKYLEKEKEQAIGLIDQTAMFMSVVTLDEDVAKMDFEDVYNSYYNQNK